MKIFIHGDIGQGFINEALERDFGNLKVALIAIILNIVKTITNMVKSSEYCKQIAIYYLTIRLRARVFYEQIVNEAQPRWLSLVENEGE